MMRRVYTIIKGHVKTWFRSKSTIFWTIAFPILLIVLFGAIFGGGTTKFDLYVQNQDLVASTPTPASHGFVTALDNTTAFNIRTVPAEMTNPLSFVRDDAQLHNRGQRLLVIPAGFQNNLTAGQALVQLYMDQSDQASASLSGIIYAVANTFATHYKGVTVNIGVDRGSNRSPERPIHRLLHTGGDRDDAVDERGLWRGQHERTLPRVEDNQETSHNAAVED